MWLSHLLQFILNVQGVIPEQFRGCGPGVFCPASSFTAIGAAFATQGYWMQADLLYYLTQTQFGLWAPLLYILSAAGGMVSLAMGMPPRTYVWFFLGPACYQWLLGTTSDVHGVEWQVAQQPQDQREVWKLSEVGLINMNIAARLRNEGGVRFSSKEAPTRSVEVSNLFVWFDEVISSSVQWMIRWTGVYSQRGNDRVASLDTNVPLAYDSVSGSRFDGGEWHLLSNLKWTYLQDITSAKLASSDLRDVFTMFMSSSCGDVLSRWVSPQALVAATNSRSTVLPASIFMGDPLSKYGDLESALAGKTAEIPDSLRNIIRARDSVNAPLADIGSFRQFIPDEALYDTLLLNEANKEIPCDLYFRIVIDGFRWETGGVYHHLVSPEFTGLTREQVVYNLFYGWNIKFGPDDATGVNGKTLPPPNIYALDHFLQDLILVHLVRNEMALQPQFYETRINGSAAAENYVTAAQRTTSQSSKFGEVYVWAMMVPHLQGLLLYILAMAYPFACILIVMPGFHKVVLTWMSFWAWAKLWDVGFAICMVLERSIWATLGNGSHFKKVADKIVDMQDWGHITTVCPPGPWEIGHCPIPVVCDGDCGTITASNFTTPHHLYQIFDRALVLGANLDLDLQNSYYIYLMAGLYFAVPAITGQLVLGAKSGMAGMIGNIAGGVASEVGRAAGTGYTGDITQRMQSVGAAMDQANYNKAMRGGLAERALALQNDATSTGLASGVLGQQIAASKAKENGMTVGYQNMKTGLDTALSAVSIPAGGVMAGYPKTALIGAGLLGGVDAATSGKDFWPGNGVLPAGQSAAQAAGAPNATASSTNAPLARAGTASGGGLGTGLSDGAQKAFAAMNPMLAQSGGVAAAALPFFMTTGAAEPGSIGTSATGTGAVGVGNPNLPGNAAPPAPPAGTRMGVPAAPPPGGGGGGGGGGVNQVGQPTPLKAAAWAADATARWGNAAANYKANSAMYAAQGVFNMQQQDWGIDQANQGALGQGFQQAGRRFEGFADGKAQAAVWGAHNKWGNNLAGVAAAMGVQTGTAAAGPKPRSMEYQSMAGLAGAGASKAAWWSDPSTSGGYFSSVGSSMGELRKNYGGASVGEYWRPWTLSGAGGLMAEAAVNPVSRYGGVPSSQLNPSAGIMPNGLTTTVQGAGPAVPLASAPQANQTSSLPPPVR